MLIGICGVEDKVNEILTAIREILMAVSENKAICEIQTSRVRFRLFQKQLPRC